MEIWTFWAPALVITLIAAILIVLGFLRGMRLRDDGASASPAPSNKREIRVYADQLREIDRDLARGLVTADEAERLRTEIARRLLEADRTAPATVRAAPAGARRLGLALVIVAIALAAALYWREGAPLYRDRPLVQRHADAAEQRAERPAQSELEEDWENDPQRPNPPETDDSFLELMEQLRAALATRPLDLDGHRLLARNEANLGNHAAAANAQRKVIELLEDEMRVADLVILAEQLVLAAGGVVSREAEEVIEEILRRDPDNGPARYYTGLMFAQTGRPDLTFRLWRRLLDESRPDAPWVPHIRATIEDLADIAGVRYTLPPENAQGSRGPSRDDIEAAMDMSEDERAEMIGGMVEGLSARLAAEGGSPDDWARLIAALGVLGQTERARAILDEARTVFADRPDALEVIEEAARSAGFEGP
ncbi:MAG: cytochrome c-type biogenesis protein CcmH [Rhodobacteraceae bacterium HLUCCA12]|nr:MAG: cytochrome c-type biogenesis protein CcmH [Rhodobacteraceae bacterium HLUCCA12]